ncbi:hypothetical protein DB31_2206 [Hyalangium minutum]|uniref:Uncharacterized protein n=2 Tax=Hyalangium minutum TaxID=394096 RepID=A0A085W9P9_9BACT|nr:hypothetical protein DB31_2206 [Hyalangium minutum]
MHGGKAMAGNTENGSGRLGSRWRRALWGTAALLLLAPGVAMQFTEEVAWGPADFALFGAMLFAACGTYELAARVTGNTAYRAAAGVALAAAFILVWLNLAVGIIGSEENPASLMYGGVLAVGLMGALLARFQPQGMARALAGTALAQAVAAVIALIAGWGNALILTGLFVALWLTSAQLFRKAAREQRPAGAAP